MALKKNLLQYTKTQLVAISSKLTVNVCNMKYYSCYFSDIIHVVVYESERISYSSYSGLFPLSANFPEFHKWSHYSGKFILGCCMKFDCGSLLRKLP